MKNLFKEIEKDLSFLQVKMILVSASENSYLVGGAVRDLLIGKVPNDYDFCTDADYDKLAVAFRMAGWKVVEAGKQFLVMVVSKNDEQYEIANFRKDGTYTDGRRPESVDVGTIDEDAQRRDFTVNALYYKLNTGEFVDPTDRGMEDIESRTLRFVGKAKERLEEDALRTARFYRFITKGFTPARKDLKVVRTMFKECYEKITPERFRNELEKICKL